MSIATLQTPLTHLGLIRISGEQNAEFLQGQLSCHVSEVSSAQSRLAVHCNPKGRILSTLRLFYINPDYYLLLPRSMISFVLEDFHKYTLFHKVSLQAVDSHWKMIGLNGPNLKNELLPILPHFSEEANQVYHYKDCILLNVPGAITRIIVLTATDSLACLPNISLKTALYPDFWEYLDIENGLPTIYPSTRELFTPHQIHYHKIGGISFNKGCYTGQEVIARMHYLGKLKNKLYKLTIIHDTPPNPGDTITNVQENPLGSIVMAAAVPEQEVSTYRILASLPTTAVDKTLFYRKKAITAIEAL